MDIEAGEDEFTNYLGGKGHNIRQEGQEENTFIDMMKEGSKKHVLTPKHQNPSKEIRTPIHAIGKYHKPN